ncbi:polysaccharide deacetylase family protein [Halopiger goleimassiliensis]|uniref:polysaccharide deacetylase family protein n=1 Tax=Halopiger goleimassiliensis TaxID=1293048 RepID=UPI0012B66A0D|nr:polysaccharide deacetylase family protein [Halopiger goleimassiliensis]
MSDTNRPPTRVDGLPDDATFALCLTHDVDRPYKGLRSLFYATQERPAYHLSTALSSANPYWQFEELMALESDLGVRSAFYVLNEQHLLADRPVREWLSSENWIQHLGRYDPTAEDVASVLRDLEAGGWEVGLHGSYHTADDPERLREERAVLEEILDGPIRGGRQHHLRLERPETWRHYRRIGLSYDTSLGSATECGFQHGYRPLRPFDDEFVVFPLTIMDQALPDPGANPVAARRTCESVLEEAAANDAVMTVLWHPRLFNEREFPGHRELYRWFVQRARDLGAWIGTPGDLYDELALEKSTGEEGNPADEASGADVESTATGLEPARTDPEPTAGEGATRNPRPPAVVNDG